MQGFKLTFGLLLLILTSTTLNFGMEEFANRCIAQAGRTLSMARGFSIEGLFNKYIVQTYQKLRENMQWVRTVRDTKRAISKQKDAANQIVIDTFAELANPSEATATKVAAYETQHTRLVTTIKAMQRSIQAHKLTTKIIPPYDVGRFAKNVRATVIARQQLKPKTKPVIIDLSSDEFQIIV